MKIGDKVVCHMEGVVTEITDYDVTVLLGDGETWTTDKDDPMWKVVL